MGSTSTLSKMLLSVMCGATVSLLLVSIVSCKGLFAPSELPAVEAWIIPYWTQAQVKLINKGVPKSNIDLWPADRFRFVGHQPNCEDTSGALTGYWADNIKDYDGRVCIWGSFDTPRTIHYSDVYRHVIVHEAEHAILYSLGYDCWDQIDKGEPGCP